jgi:hypothetical protein
MKKVFISSPLRGRIEENILREKKYCREAVLKGFVPLVPHLYFTLFLNDNIEAES